MDAFGLFGDLPPWFSFSANSAPDAYFTESGPSASSPVAQATCPSADLSNPTLFDSDLAANYNSFGQVPDEDPLTLGDESLWDWWLSSLDDPVHGHRLLLEPHAHEVENEGLLNVFNVETNVVLPDVSTSSTNCSRWQNLVWLIRACRRFSLVAAASLRAKVPEANIKGVSRKRGKFVCETRITKRMRQEKKSLIEKVWLGTYQTRAQAARARDVGKYFFNAKKTKTFFDPNTERMLSTRSTQLLAQPLEVLVAKVKEIAKDYGINGQVTSMENFGTEGVAQATDEEGFHVYSS